MVIILLLIVFLFSLVFAAIAMHYILIISYKKRLYDMPDKRKLHTIPISRLGGLSFTPITIAAFNLGIGLCGTFIPESEVIYSTQFSYLFVGLILLFLLGLCDDLIGVAYKKKFFVQILAASFFPLSGLWVNSLGGLFGIYEIPPIIGIPLTVFIVVYITNAINLIDGIDGLASGLSCIALSIIGIISFFSSNISIVFFIIATLGVLLPFLYYNIFGAADHYRKLFMGDAGSLTLGYIMSFLVLSFNHASPDFDPFKHGFQWIVFSTLIIPLFDVIRVVYSRFRGGRPLFKPDKNHIHHKFLRTGLSSMGTMLYLLFISLLFVGINYFLIDYIPITVLFLLDVVLWISMHLVLNQLIYKREKKSGKIWYYEYNSIDKTGTI
jgi:UDP-N-acetylmuramyl pentapeptide phosphotransferase/UDP-N-acetylglucosamine-1-phosphate transferase